MSLSGSNWSTFFSRTPRCVVLLAILSLLYFTPVWLNPTELLYSGHSDIVRMHYPWRVFAVRNWQSTHSIPLWCPYCCGGQPFQADMQSTLFYPPHLVFYFVPLSWIAPLYGVLTWLHVLLAGVAMFSYARGRNLEPYPALIAAIGFMFAGKWLTHVFQAGHYVFLPLAWFPLVVLCVERAIERLLLRYAIAAGCFGALLFTGAAPQLTLYAGLLAAGHGLWTVMRVVWGNSTYPTTGAMLAAALSSLGWWSLTGIVAGVIATSLAAIQLLPALELASYSTRAVTGRSESGHFYDLTFTDAEGFGQRVLSLIGLQHFGGNAWESVGAFGLLWSALGIVAIARCRCPDVRYYGLFLLLLILFAFGPSMPFYLFLKTIVPGLNLFRIPARILLFAGFPLGMLAGHFTQDLLTGPDVRRQALRWSPAIAACIVYLYLAATWAWTERWGLYPLCAALLGTSLIGFLVWQSVHSWGDGWFLAGWLIVLLADLWAIHWPHVQTRPVAEVYPANDTLMFLAAHPGPYRTLDQPPPQQPPDFSPLTPALCYLHGIESVRGHNPTDLFRYKQYLNFIAGRTAPPEPVQVPLVKTVEYPQLLDLLSVRYLLLPSDQPLPEVEQHRWWLAKFLRDTRIHLETDVRPGGLYSHPYTAYEGKNVFPRAFIVGEACLLAGGEQVLKELAETDFRHTVLVDVPPSAFEPSAASPVATFHTGPAFQEATILRYEPNRVVIEVSRDTSGYLVLLDVWYPGWKCHTAEGVELPVWRGNYLFRVVAVPPGRHRLEFSFAPTAYCWGRGISLTTAAALFCLFLWVFIRTNAHASLSHWLRKRSAKTV